MTRRISAIDVVARPPAVVPATTTWAEFPQAVAALQPAGPRWEVYGPHHDDPAEVWTEVNWLLA